MVEFELLRSLGLMIGTAFVLVMATRWANVPSIVVYIIAGLALGPITGLLTVSHTIELIAEFGIALLLFLVGLELSIDKIKDVGPVAVVAGLGQVVFTAAGGFAFAYLLGFEPVQAIFIAVALTFSSTVVVVKLLDQKKEINDLYGRIAVGIFLVQDLVVVIALTFVAGLGQSETVELATVGYNLAMAFGGMILLLGGALLASRYVLPPLFDWIAKAPDAMFIWSLFWCFLLVLGAEAMQLSVEIGAFLAGIALAQLPYSHDLRRRVHPLVNFFIAIFFISLGLQMELEAAILHWEAAVVLSLFVLIGNPLIFMVIITWMGYTQRTSFLTSVTVAQISEFSFIFAAMGLSAGLIDESILSLIAVVGLVTISLSAYMILYNHQLYALMDRWGLLRIFKAPDTDEDTGDKNALHGHVIVVGMNTMGRCLVERLNAQGITVAAIDTDRSKLETLPDTVTRIHGDAVQDEVLHEASFSKAKLLISSLNIEEPNDLLAYRCRRAGIPCSIHAFDHSVREDLRDLDVDHLMFSKAEGANEIINELNQRILPSNG